MQEKASVIVCAYNYARFLPRCLESVLSQTRPADEVIVVDDGSTDGTPEVVARFSGVTYIRQERAGKAAAFSRGFAASRGELICHLDADDYWLPRKLERTLQELTQSDAGCLTHDGFYVDAQDNFLYGSERATSETRSTRRYGLRDMLLMCFIYRPHRMAAFRFGIANTVCVWRKCVLDCMPLPAALGLAVDGALILAGARYGLAFLPERLSAYRHHGENSFVCSPDSMMHQRQLFEWAARTFVPLPQEDVQLLRALALEADVHAAVHNHKEPMMGSYKAAVLLSILARQGLVPHWKHLALPAASLFQWTRLRRSFG